MYWLGLALVLAVASLIFWRRCVREWKAVFAEAELFENIKSWEVYFVLRRSNVVHVTLRNGDSGWPYYWRIGKYHPYYEHYCSLRGADKVALSNAGALWSRSTAWRDLFCLPAGLLLPWWRALGTFPNSHYFLLPRVMVRASDRKEVALADDGEGGLRVASLALTSEDGTVSIMRPYPKRE